MTFMCVSSELVLLTASLLLLIIGSIFKKSYSLIYCGAILALAVAFGMELMPGYCKTSSFVLDNFRIDNPAIKQIILFVSIIVLLVSYDLRERNPLIAVFEYPVLYIVCTLGILISVSASNFLVLYLGLELQALSMYVMVALDRKDVRASESGLRYYILGSAASALMLYGFSIIYSITGALNIHEIVNAIGTTQLSRLEYLFCTSAITMVLVGLCFKIASFPMHGWTPEVYKGASSVVTIFLATVPKIAAFSIISRFLYGGLANFAHYKVFYYIAGSLGIGSMIVGIFGALAQKNFKRFMAYSSIQNVGYIMVLAPIATRASLNAALQYLCVYSVLVLGIFCCIMRLYRDDTKISDLKISDLAGLVHKDKLAAISMGIFFLSMAGIPPLAGFATKVSLFSTALSSGMGIIVTIAALLSVAGMYYYLMIIKTIFLDDGDATLAYCENGKSKFGACIIIACLIFNFTLLFGHFNFVKI